MSTDCFHNPCKRHSPINKIYFPGQGKDTTYDVTGAPYAGRRTCLGTIYTTQLLWTPDYHLKGRKHYLHEVVCPGVRRRPVYFVQRTSGAKFLVVHLHGNMCDIGDMQPAAVEQAARWEAHVLLPEYPGYGVAPGISTVKDVEWAVMSSALYAMKDLGVPHDRIIIFGRSIGTGPAALLARTMTEMDMPPAALILQSPYTSLRDMGIKVAGRIAHVTLNRCRTKRNLPHVNAPVLILHADRDEVIPWQQGKLNADSRKGHKFVTELHTQRGCTHNEFSIVDDVCTPGATFIDKHVKLVEHKCITVNQATIPMYLRCPTEVIAARRRLGRVASQAKAVSEVSCMCGAMVGEAFCGCTFFIYKGLRDLFRSGCNRLNSNGHIKKTL
mmetsp:Transcript_3394/g.6068  ORF Transcript_3394/g.6068 Transcript_3394/m.6068 type:complete len:384 (+) Transcript_3394:70-1221(+)